MTNKEDLDCMSIFVHQMMDREIASAVHVEYTTVFDLEIVEMTALWAIMANTSVGSARIQMDLVLDRL